MAKKSKETKNILSLEENFLKIMEGEDDLSSFFDDRLKQRAEKNAPGPVCSLKEEDAPEIQAVQEKKPVDPCALKEFGLELSVAEDRMAAHLTGNKAHSFTAATIVAGLEEKGVIQGINFDSIVKIVSIMEKDGSWSGRIVVAQGALPTEQGKISFPFIAKGDWDDPEKAWVIDGKMLSFTALIELFNRDRLPEEEEISRVVVRPVKSGETLAVIDGKRDPAPGFDVYGRMIPVGKPVFEAGENVRRNDKTGKYEATTFGYLCIAGNKISVIPPIVISQDHMAAYFVNCPSPGVVKEPSPASIKYSLIRKGVDENRISPSLIEKLCTGLKQDAIRKPLFKIAYGRPPTHGVDAKLVLNVDLEEKAGIVLENDSIDLKERNVIHTVSEGDLLATKYFSSTGTPGSTLFKKVIEQRCGDDFELTIKGPILSKKHADKVEYYAKVAGNVSFENNRLTLTDVYRVAGNVDYATGNIEVTTGLIVTESIMPGFKVSTGGDTVIGGTIENGAHVLVRGNLKVGKGIIGKNTKVIVIGSLQVAFVQDAEIMVKGDVEIESYSFNGNIRAGGEIVVKRALTHRGGKVVGGIVCATKGISISTLGGPANKNTLAAIQKDAESLAVLKKIQIEIQDYTGTVVKIMKSLQLEALDLNHIRTLIEKTPEAKREMLMKVVANLSNLIKMRSELSEKEKSLGCTIDLGLRNAKIRVANDAYLGNKVRIGDQQIILDRDLGPTVFKLQNDKIVF